LDNAAEIVKTLDNLSGTIGRSGDVSIILAAGHGKRIKSEKSKMLHEIWGKPSVCRVCDAAARGLDSDNQIVVVGKKALDVAEKLGRKKGRVFVYQEEQRGTGHAVQIALAHAQLRGYSGSVFIFPGDMGLLEETTVKKMKERFYGSDCDMLALTGTFEGAVEDNYYGRILTSTRYPDRIIEIKEHRDILAMEESHYEVEYGNGIERFTPGEMLNIREFNVGVYAMKTEPLRKLVKHIDSNNVQGEIYITDLIKIFNDRSMKVCPHRVRDNQLVVSFNVKSVLKQMDDTFRSMVYEKLKDIITIDDPEDFYIAEETVEAIIRMDSEGPPLDISVGKGVHIGPGITLNRGVAVEKNTILQGTAVLGSGVFIGESVLLSTFPGQVIRIGDGSRVLRGNVIKGSVDIGSGTVIESGVRITGSTGEPVKIGDNVLIKGMTYIYGSIIENELLIEHSILKCRRVRKVVLENGEVQPVKYILPSPEGLDAVSGVSDNGNGRDRAGEP